MRLLVVFCHPDPESYGAAIFRTACEALRAAGHELRVIDLYAEGFDPVFTRAEKRWAEGWVAIYPTWFYGLPAMLKGWLDRVWLPGVTFQVASSKKRTIRGELQNIRRFVGITTSGSPWWWLRVIGDPGRSLLMKGLRPLYARGCRMSWLQLHDMNHVTAAEREAFLAKVDRTLRSLT